MALGFTKGEVREHPHSPPHEKHYWKAREASALCLGQLHAAQQAASKVGDFAAQDDIADLQRLAVTLFLKMKDYMDTRGRRF